MSPSSALRLGCCLALVSWMAAAPAGATGAPALPTAAGPSVAPVNPVAAAPRDRIYGGAPVPVCGWPAAVELDLPNNRLCSGTLVAPQIVLYAAHCGANVVRINFGENDLAPARSVVPAACVVYPGHQQDDGTDFAYCRLPQPIDDVPIVPILMGCEAAALREGRQVVLVGFGDDEAKQTGIKRAVTTVAHQTDAGGIFLGGNGQDTCNGDSGGPAYVQLDATDGLPGPTDGSWRIFGITSYGPPNTCGTGGHDTLAAHGVPWIERDSGIDITPCTDADGTWHPGPACGNFPTAPAAPGSWDAACVSDQLSGPGATCGAPFSATPPTVTIVSPTSATHLASGSQTLIVVHAAAGSAPVAAVHLTLDGAAVAAAGPAGDDFQFGPVALSRGPHTLVAAAIDTYRVIGRNQAALSVAEDGSVTVSDHITFVRASAAGCTAAAAVGPWAALACLAAYARRRRRT